jgi:tRNA nucleotidyltransferase (CCA-adding enzyme)
MRSLEDSLKRADFKVYDTTYTLVKEKIYVILKTQKENLSKTMVHVGPPVMKESNSQDFIDKWKDHPDVIKGPYKENNRWNVVIKRQYTEVIPFLKEQIKCLSMGKHLDQIIRKKYEIIELDMLLNEKFSLFWTEYLDGKESWER